MIDKIRQFLYDSTIGLADQYRRRSIELVKIHAATVYLQVVKAMRQYLLAVFAMLFLLLVAAIAVVVLPALLILALPVSAAWKMAGILLLALIDVAVPALYLKRLFSEESWMKLCRADEFVKDAMNN